MTVSPRAGLVSMNGSPLKWSVVRGTRRRLGSAVHGLLCVRLQPIQYGTGTVRVRTRMSTNRFAALTDTRTAYAIVRSTNATRNRSSGTSNVAYTARREGGGRGPRGRRGEQCVIRIDNDYTSEARFRSAETRPSRVGAILVMMARLSRSCRLRVHESCVVLGPKQGPGCRAHQAACVA